MTTSKSNIQPRASELPVYTLLRACDGALQQCEALLRQVSAEDYVRTGADSAAVGAHLRHIVDRFQSLLRGLETGAVAYDARQRDPEVEHNRDAAAFVLGAVRRQLDGIDPGSLTGQSLRINETVHAALPAVTVSSTAERELMALVSHTVHHQALIASILRQLGHHLAPEFGKAPSTLVFERG